MSTLAELIEQFLAFEADHKPLDWDVAGVPVWAYVRQRVFDDFSRRHGFHAERQAPSTKHYLRAAAAQRRDLGRVFERYDHRRLNESPVLFLSHSRHYPLGEGHVSPYTHFLLKGLPPEAYWDLQFSDRGHHHVDDGLERVVYLDALYQTAFKGYALRRRWGRFRSSLRSASRDFSHFITNHLGFAPDAEALDKLIWNAVRVHHGWGSTCDWLLDRVRPTLIVNVVHYNWPTLAMTLRARLRNIVVAELQHGTVSPEHIAYNVVPSARVRTTPDYFLSFGEFWSQMARGLNLPPSHIPAVGFSWLENRMASAKTPTRGKTLLVLSQRSIGVELSKLAVQAAGLLKPRGWTVTYRLHPGETADWRQRLPWLERAPLQICEGSSDLYRQFSEAGAQLGVYSTALFEGVAFSLPTLIARLPGADALSPLVEFGGARFVSDAGEICRALEDPGSWSAPAELVQRVWRPRAVETFRKFVAVHTPLPHGGVA